jgi:hydroxymethylglutaryl-CoA synthase
MTAIEAVGVHVPRYRAAAEEFEDAWGQFQGANISEVAVAGPDEDTLTMAVEAAERAFEASTRDRSEVDMLTLGTTTPPLEESDVAGHLVEMLGLSRTVESAIFGQSTRAGVEALRSAIDRRSGPALVVASDSPSGEPDEALGQAAGAGAVALVVADDGPVSVAGEGNYSRSFPGTRYRERGEETVQAYGATEYERRAYTETIAGALESLDADLDALAPTAPDGALPYRATARLSDDPSVYQRADSLGDTGAASPFFGALAAWEADETDLAVVGYGDGASVDVVHLQGTATPNRSSTDTVSLSYPEYLRIRGEIVQTGGDK